MDEEFPEYQPFLEKAEVEDPPFALPDPPQAAPSISGQKRGGTQRPDDDTEDTGASGENARKGAQPDGQTPGSSAPSLTLEGKTPTPSRAAAMAVFVEALFFSDDS
jgi:hypothetical protein